MLSTTNPPTHPQMSHPPRPPPKSPPKRRPGRPPTYIFSKPDSELSENERRLKGSVIKRRLRQNRSYHRKKRLKQLAAQQSIPQTSTISTHPPLLPPTTFQINTPPFFPPPPAHPPAFPNHASTSNVALTIDNNKGIPFLSISSPHPPQPHPQNPPDVDESHLLDHIFRLPTPPSPTTAPRPYLSPDLDLRLASLPKSALDNLKHLILFPSSFSVEAAHQVLGLSRLHPTSSLSILQPLVDVKLIRQLPSGRFILNDIAKSLLSTDTFPDASQARLRFVTYFIDTFRLLHPRLLSRSAQSRLDAMKFFDVERKNVNVAFQMCHDINRLPLTVDFLTRAATVLRYSISARQRADMFGNLVAQMDAARQTIAIPLHADARIRLALAEASFDLLQFDRADKQLRRAISIMAGADSDAVPVESSVLALILLAEVRISDHDFEEGKKLLLQALKTLNESELRKSTFAACCLLNLCSVYLTTAQIESALHSVNGALDLLAELGFSQMPIYANALGTLGTVHFQKGNTSQAQNLFSSALNLIQSWMSNKDWDEAPVQHCAHLDIFLAESIAQTYMKQDRRQEAAQMAVRARQQREERGLALVDVPGGSDAKRDRRPRVYTRHLY